MENDSAAHAVGAVTQFPHHGVLLAFDPGITPNLEFLPGMNLLKLLIGAVVGAAGLLAVGLFIWGLVQTAAGGGSSNPTMKAAGKTKLLWSFGLGIGVGCASTIIAFATNLGGRV